jgi:anti-sigma-K factor RskA
MTQNREDHEAYELVGAYALDAMDERERRAFASHLEDCAVCADEVTKLQATVALLGEAAEAAPPPGLRSRVLSEIGTIPQDPPIIPRGRLARSRRFSTRHLFAAAAAVLAFAVVSLGGLYAQTSAQLARLERAAASNVGDDLLAVLSASDAQVNEVTGPAGGSARFVWSDERNLGVLVGERMHAAPEGHTYALWLIHDDQAQYVGSFRPGEHGQVAAVISGGVDTAEMLGVTTEPAGTITRPTGQLVMSATLS